MTSRTLFFVNSQTRQCRVLSGPPDGQEHLANVMQAAQDGFHQVSDAELDAWRTATAAAIDAGWNPNRMRYDTWLKVRAYDPEPEEVRKAKADMGATFNVPKRGGKR